MLIKFFVIWALAYISIRYLTKGLTFLAKRYFDNPKWIPRKINSGETHWQADFDKVKSGLLIGSIFRSALIALLFSIPDTWVPFYYSISDRGWLYFSATIIGYALYFDLWFYISHRFIFHHRLMYKPSHLVHHRFRDPVIPVRNAFSVSEMVITAIGGYAIVFFVPFHPVALLIGRELLVQFVNIYNHLGYEIMPKGFTKHPVFRYLTTPTHHTLHHMHNNCNYSLFVNYDYMFNTQYKKYEEIFEAIHNRSQKSDGDLLKNVI